MNAAVSSGGERLEAALQQSRPLVWCGRLPELLREQVFASVPALRDPWHTTPRLEMQLHTLVAYLDTVGAYAALHPSELASLATQEPAKAMTLFAESRLHLPDIRASAALVGELEQILNFALLE